MNDFELIFLLEEPSMKGTLEILLPKIIPPKFAINAFLMKVNKI